MPGAQSHGGWRRHCRLARCGADADYGSVPAVPSWNWIPFLDDGFGLKATSPRYTPNTNYGASWKRNVMVHHRQTVEGDFSPLLWPEVTEFLLSMAIDRVTDSSSDNYQDLYGHVIDFFNPVDPRRYVGVVANELSLECDHSEDGDAQLTLSLLAQAEKASSVTEGDVDYSSLTPVPFMPQRATLRLDGSDVTDVENWTLSINNNVGDAPYTYDSEVGAGVRGHAVANQREASLELTKMNDDDAFADAIRGGGYMTFEARFYHPAGHFLQIVLPYLHVTESDEDGTPDQQATESPTLEAREAPSGTHEGEDVIYGVDLASGGTTTLAGGDVSTTEGATTTTGV